MGDHSTASSSPESGWQFDERPSRSRRVAKLSHRPPVPKSPMRRLLAIVPRLRGRTPLFALAFGVLGGSVFFVNFLLYSDYFALSLIEVFSPKEELGEKVVRHLHNNLEVTEGLPLTAIDTIAIVKSLRTLPEVSDVTVEKVWPDKLLLFVKPRAVEGIVVTANGSFSFDGGGFLFAEATADDFRLLHGPVLTGFGNANFEVGGEIPAPDFERFLLWRSTIAQCGSRLRDAFSEIHIGSEGAVTLVAGNGARIDCGLRSAAEAGPILEAIFDATAELSATMSVNLSAREHVTVSRRGAVASR